MEEKKEKRWNAGGKHLAVSETESGREDLNIARP